MATIEEWIGTCSNGAGVHWAKRDDGQWFSRYENHTAYGLQFSKWKKDTPEFVTGCNNAYSGEWMEYEYPRISAGFGSPCVKLTGKPSFRLPKG